MKDENYDLTNNEVFKMQTSLQEPREFVLQESLSESSKFSFILSNNIFLLNKPSSKGFEWQRNQY